MDYQITTTYCREDIEGFYDAYLAGKKSIRISKKIMRFITTLIAVAFWGFAAVVLIANLSTKSLQIMIDSVPLTIVFVLLGLWMCSIGRRGFRSKASWKAYPFKGEQLVFHFSNDSFTLTQRNSETKISYAGIVRLCEDKFCFYLFTSPQNAHILPKRDFLTAIDSFRKDITAATNLPMES